MINADGPNDDNLVAVFQVSDKWVTESIAFKEGTGEAGILIRKRKILMAGTAG